MSLRNATCHKCGNVTVVDDTEKSVLCEYCGSALDVEESIQRYITNNITNNIKAENVIVSGNGVTNKDHLLKNANTNETLFGDYVKAHKLYVQVTEEYPDDYRGWLGLFRIETHNDKVDFEYHEFIIICDYVNRALICAPPDKKTEIEKEWTYYCSKHNDFIRKKKSDIIKKGVELNSLKQKEDSAANEIEKITNDIKESDQTIISHSKSVNLLSEQIIKTENQGKNYDTYNKVVAFSFWLLVSISVVLLLIFKDIVIGIFSCIPFVVWLLSSIIYPMIKETKIRHKISELKTKKENEEKLLHSEKEKIEKNKKIIKDLENQKDELIHQKNEIEKEIADIKERYDLDKKD